MLIRAVVVTSQERPELFHVVVSGWAETPGGRDETPAAIPRTQSSTRTGIRGKFAWRARRVRHWRTRDAACGGGAYRASNVRLGLSWRRSFARGRVSEGEDVNREERELFNPKNRRTSSIHARRPATLRSFDRLRTTQAQGPSSPPLGSLSLPVLSLSKHRNAPRHHRTLRPAPTTLRQAQGPSLPAPKFVEPVETNPEITAAFVPPLRPFDTLRDRKLRVLPPHPQFVELACVAPVETSKRTPTPPHPSPRPYDPSTGSGQRKLKGLPPAPSSLSLPVLRVAKHRNAPRHRRSLRPRPYDPSTGSGSFPPAAPASRCSASTS